MADEEELSVVEPVSLVTKDFPIVVIKESAALTDDRRVQLLDQLDELLEAGKPHAIIMDLTSASELPEGQRVFISESLQMREELVTSTWISLAIVVSSNVGGSAELASFWQKVTPTPTQVFTNMMSAVVWTRQALEKHARATREANEFETTSGRPSDPIAPAARRSELGSRRSEAQVERSSPKPRSPKKKGKAQADEGRSFLRSPVLWLAIVGILASGGVFALNASFEPGLSSSEADAFKARKDQFAVRVFRKVSNKLIPLAANEPCPPASQLRFEAVLPTRAYMLMIGARSATDTYVAVADQGKYSVGPLEIGVNILSPKVELGADAGQEWLHFVACSERITTDDCKLESEGTVLSCPQACTVYTFQVNKAAPGS